MVKIIAVVGTGSGCGKTTLACRILQVIPGLGAVKISPRDGASRVEWGAGAPGKDTDLFVANGALRVARIIGPRESVVRSWDQIKDQFEGCKAVVMEGTRALDIPGDRFIAFVVGDTQDDQQYCINRDVAAISDVIVDGSSHLDMESLADVIREFLSAARSK